MQTFLWDSLWGHFVECPPCYIESTLASKRAGAWELTRLVGFHCLVLTSEKGHNAAVIRAKSRDEARSKLETLPEWQRRNK